MGFASGPGGMSMLAEGTIVLPDPAMVNVSGPVASLTAHGRPFMSRSEGNLTRYIVLLAEPPTVNGEALPASGRHDLDTIVLTGPGLMIRAEVPIVLTVERDAITIRLR